MATFKLYAHEESEEPEYETEEIVKRTGCDYDKVFAIIDNRPLYEVEFEFDEDTGKCIAIRLDEEGIVYRPRLKGT